MIQAIETSYKGYRFRSRLEARWAVFFDALGFTWEYEPQGFEVGWDEERDKPEWMYLPDFFLPESGTWVEVKGSLDDLPADYLDMIGWAVDWGGALPGIANSYGTTRGLLWLGPIPSWDTCRGGPPTHVILQHNKGGFCNYGSFLGRRDFRVTDSGDNYFDASVPAGGDIRAVLEARVYDPRNAWVLLGTSCDRDVFDAYRAARSARFEHGETPGGRP